VQSHADTDSIQPASASAHSVSFAPFTGIPDATAASAAADAEAATATAAATSPTPARANVSATAVPTPIVGSRGEGASTTADQTPAPDPSRVRGYCRTSVLPGRATLQLTPRPVARAPFAAIPRWTEALEGKLEKIIAAHRSGNEQRMSDSIDDLNRMPSIALADAKCSQGRAGRTIGNLDCLEETDQLPADTDEPPTAPPGRTYQR
jgi:hypothetical protein